MKTRKHKSVIFKNTNGYPVLFIPTSDKTFHITCKIHSGYIHETKKNCGITHLLEHILVSGWKHCAGSCNQYWDKRGAYINATTDKASTHYYIKGLSIDADMMIQYMTTIVSNPYWSTSILEREKQAIKDELLTLSTEPNIDGADLFNQRFYTIEGIQYSDDWNLQIRNLRKIKLDDVKQLYEEVITPNNIVFIVIGDISSSELTKSLQKHLKPKQTIPPTYTTCYSFKHEIDYIYGKTENSAIFLGFSIHETENILLMHVLKLTLHAMLFDELRTKNTLLYDIDIHIEVTRCGSCITFELNLQHDNIIPCLKRVYNCLDKYSKIIPPEYCTASIKQEVYKYTTNEKTLMDYYLNNQNVDKMVKEDIIQYLHGIKPSDISKLCARLCRFEQSLCVYQGPKNIHLTWDKIKN